MKMPLTHSIMEESGGFLIYASSIAAGLGPTPKLFPPWTISASLCFWTLFKVIYGDDENQRFYDEHYFRKQELRELKQLQKQEQKQFQDLVKVLSCKTFPILL
jgi:hypothetical protein